MNDVLQLKGHFEQASRNSSMGARNIPRGKTIAVEHIHQLKTDLLAVYNKWKNDSILDKKLVSVYYTRIIPKSSRIQSLLFTKEDSVVGAKFSPEKTKHIITHCVSLEVIEQSINLLTEIESISNTYSISVFTYELLDEINHNKSDFVLENYPGKKSRFIATLVDAYSIEKFGIEETLEEIKYESALITIYDTGIRTKELLHRLNIDFPENKTIDETTLLLSKDQYDTLKEKAPYLIAMSVTDIANLSIDESGEWIDDSISIPEPTTEPTVGVIDTPFDNHVYFSNWVDNRNYINKEIPITPADYDHGTKVTSIIVDGPTLNPELEDGCGRFKVRHFGVVTGGEFSSFDLLTAIKQIVRENRDIKVWNLSLGSELEVNDNFISPEAAILDKIQYEYDVIFIIAGTNNNHSEQGEKKIGSPADSINGLVVNSVNQSNQPASYSRIGPVLSYFNKPDISYYGGDEGEEIKTYFANGKSFVMGTSFAAPWIARKMAYLIHVMGLSREVAKALLIDSACEWSTNEYSSRLIGFGVVPKNINDIIKSKDSEIRFVISEVSKKYDTYNNNIPIPFSKDIQPYIAKATLCYFPKCSRNQGVDYTNTELDLYFGKIKPDGNIETINDNVQDNDKPSYCSEEDARRYYRKWDNVKHICEKQTDRKRGKKLVGNGSWGLSVKTKERLRVSDGRGLRFGVVVTLKELNGKNRIEEFIKQCSLKGWLVNRINVENQIHIYNKAEENVKFD